MSHPTEPKISWKKLSDRKSLSDVNRSSFNNESTPISPRSIFLH